MKIDRGPGGWVTKGSTGASDAGGIAARRGFRIQDHVAARIALETLLDPDAVRLECETADDIVVRRSGAGGLINEYVQVKTTEADSKWNLTELAARTKGRKGSSVCERSLLCDTDGDTAWFRLVTTRAVSAKLVPFTRERGRRDGEAAFEALVGNFAKKYKDTKSNSGRTLADWSRHLLWEVEADERSIHARNTKTLLTLAQGRGLNPAFDMVEGVYERLVSKTRSMGDAPSSEIADKAWTRADIMTWWEERLAEMRADAADHVKVYQIVNVPAFFSELCAVDDGAVKRALYAYDVEYDGNVWRMDELTEHLLDWLPEVALSPRILATYNHLSARRLPGEALRALERRGPVDVPGLIAGLMLHAILRHHFGAEPIACRIFFLVGGAMRSTSAHIVPLAGGDEIWLGRSRLVAADSHRAVIDEVLAELRTAVTRDVLMEERDIIIQLREPRHLRADTLDGILVSTGKTSDLLRVVRLPILVAYDSATLGAGFNAAYLTLLKREVRDEYDQIKAGIDDELRDVEVSLFLVPVECAATLARTFEARLRRR
ncbi:hypothetical protein AO398_23700 [Methylobacterium sp. GXS13]|uniref:HamA C-terminal domain-containing protein n=1 Tax=Methylobacterium sp. GXS13 TaxID=1730094 RepID=UPI00071BA588|nr:dsDNA nuclease domain-containing protein [Methylobacterium sp. GXS13]KST57979.1 hypothetical protein AO398_23700 [Methylobacterium sp. GXS13]